MRPEIGGPCLRNGSPPNGSIEVLIITALIGLQALEGGGAFTIITFMGGAAVQCAPGRMQIHLTSLRGPWLGSLQPLLQMAIPWRCVTRPISLPRT